MEWILLISVLLYAVFFVWNISTDDEDGRLYSAIFLTISVIIFVALFSLYENRNTPTLLDVYRGKTTLEITYKDSIPVDSVVVFK